MTMTAEIRSPADDPRVSPELARGWEEVCVWLDVGVAVRVTGRARDRRFAKVLEDLKALPPARARGLAAYPGKCRADEERSEEASQRAKMRRSLLCGYMAGPIALADQGAVEASYSWPLGRFEALLAGAA
jgi:hypothetical protein